MLVPNLGLLVEPPRQELGHFGGFQQRFGLDWRVKEGPIIGVKIWPKGDKRFKEPKEGGKGVKEGIPRN